MVVPAGGGRFDGQDVRDDIDAVLREMPFGRAASGPSTDDLAALAGTAGFDLVDHRRTASELYDESPLAHVERIEQRTWSGLWDLDDEAWALSVQPTIDRLLALPEPDRPRRRTRSHRVLVFARR